MTDIYTIVALIIIVIFSFKLISNVVAAKYIAITLFLYSSFEMAKKYSTEGYDLEKSFYLSFTQPILIALLIAYFIYLVNKKSIN